MTSAVGIVALALAMPVAAPSAETASSPRSSSRPAPVIEFSDEELKLFARTSLAVEAISGKWQPRISGAGSKTEEQDMREQAMGEMVEAVEQKGLSVGRYNQIALAVQSNPEVARTVQSYRAAQP
ncbi:DUF4168 domain-containing protein [Thalassobaculum sp.]|uniref:DUF4168 domain-containing protein n=1 Tax=Thalassobaculum sp. TaxID=2022740 RepID=UPI0032F09439